MFQNEMYWDLNILTRSKALQPLRYLLLLSFVESIISVKSIAIWRQKDYGMTPKMTNVFRSLFDVKIHKRN